MSLFLLVPASPSIVSAHGGGAPYVGDEPLGEFMASVWLQPRPFVIGDTHVAIALSKDDSVVLNQIVSVKLLLESGEELEVLATHQDPIKRFLYEADFEISEAGRHQVEVVVNGQESSLAFDIVVFAKPWVRSLLAWTVIIVGSILIWLYETRRANRVVLIGNSFTL